MTSPRIIFLEQTASTNTWLRQLPDDAFHHGIVCAADHQTGGRGQGSRTWHSAPGMNLLFSVGFTPGEPDRLILLTLSIAREVAHYLSELTAEPVRIKWPNDLLVSGGKIGGILTETMFRGNRLQRMVIGIGLNINQLEFPGTARQGVPHPPVSLAAVTGVEWHRESLLNRLLLLIDRAYADWERSEPDLCSKIHSSLIGYGEWVQVELDHQPIGLRKCLGLTAAGELLLLDEQMDVRRYTHEHLRLIPVE